MTRCWSEPVPFHLDFRVRRQSLQRGSLLARQGDPFDAIYLLVDGCMSLREVSVDGAERIVAFRTPGELIGIEGLKSGRYAYTAESITAVAVCRLKGSRLRSAESALTQQLLDKAIGQLPESSFLWAGRPAADRVAAFIDDFARRMGQRPDPFKMPMTRAEIGSYLGLSEETVVRSLKRLRQAAPAETT